MEVLEKIYLLMIFISIFIRQYIESWLKRINYIIQHAWSEVTKETINCCNQSHLTWLFKFISILFLLGRNWFNHHVEALKLARRNNEIVINMEKVRQTKDNDDEFKYNWWRCIVSKWQLRRCKTSYDWQTIWFERTLHDSWIRSKK